MVLLLLISAYARGMTSSREIERRCETDIAFRYLTGGERPDHDMAPPAMERGPRTKAGGTGAP
ncbi:transposase [Cystobacter ferrugineus]|uniref:transposase n=1 Tax=Cystobacter ferrugineus TaxID=83449 RepID=UPI00090354D4